MNSLHGVSRDQLFTKARPGQQNKTSFNRTLRYRKYTIGFSLFWTLLLGTFLVVEIRDRWKSANDMARADAYMSYQKDVLFRHWASQHGGVYVPATTETPPNPYLQNIPERDVTTPSGRVLTLMNPAYMTRQMHELARDRFGVISHISSLNPIRPANSPDAWEAKALKLFETGVPEVSEVTKNQEGQPVIRFMRPFITEQSCLKCHADQGYHVGQVRGGISVTAPLSAYYAEAKIGTRDELVVYISIWLVGLAGILFGFYQLNLRRRAHLVAIESLRISEEKFATVFHDAPVLISITSLPDGTYQDVNEYALSISGFKREEFIGKKSTELGWISSSDHEVMLSSIKQNGRISGLELNFRAKDGHALQGLLNGNLITVDGKEYLLTVTVDITERRRVEAALARNDAELSAIYEHSPSMKLIVDKEGYVRRLNRAAATFVNKIASSHTAGDSGRLFSFLGCLQSGGAACNCSFGIDRHHCPLRSAILDTRQSGVTHDRIEVSTKLTPVGSATPFILLASTALIEVDEEKLVLVCMEDISQQRVAEQRIREQAALLDVTHDAIIVIDLASNVTYCNRAAENIYGWRAEDMLGQPLAKLIPEKHQHLLEDSISTVRNQGSWSGELQFINKNSKFIIARCQAVLMRDRDGSEHAILLSSSDVTEAKQIEAQFLRAQRLESIGSLAGGVAHDLNNVFGPIMLSLSTLRSHAHDPQLLEIVELIDKSVHRGSDIVRKLLLFGRGTDNNATREPVSFPALVGEIRHLLQETFPKNIKLSFSTPADLWPVIGDKTQLYQVLLNLCVNARDAMPQGGSLSIRAENITLTETLIRDKPGIKAGPHLLVSVTDTGTGIPADIVEKIFDPFFTTKPVGHGSGLGLSTSLGIIRNHSGIINVRTSTGTGSTFTVYLPATPNPKVQCPGTDDEPIRPGNGEHILVVDDEPSILHSAKLLLTGNGYRVTTASSGLNAIEILDCNGLDDLRAVITDFMMPGMDGAQLINAIRAKIPGMPAITMSGLRDSREISARIPPPQVHHLMKPFSAEELLAALNTLLDTRSR